MRAILFISLCSAFSVFGQQSDLELLNHYALRSIGPASMSGRVTSIAVLHSNPNVMFIGTASGGVWKSNSGGLRWESVFDTMGTTNIGAVAIQQNNADVVWVGTGEGNPRNSHNSGTGIFKSLDGGRSWKRMGLNLSKTIYRILINPQNGDEVYVAVMGSIWGANAERGVYKTTDGGNSWNKVLYVNDLTGCAELVMDPSNPNKLFASMWEYQRKPYTFTSGGKSSGFYMTVDGGKNWKKLTEKEGLPAGDLGRIGIAISASNPNRVYAMIESKDQEMFSSIDGGFHWQKVSSDRQMGNRPFYYSEIYVDPGNEYHVISLWSQVTHSLDGGKTWNTLLDWGHIHPDHHAFYIHPSNPQLMLDGNDGGLNLSTDGGKNWRFIANLPVGQFYHVSVDDEIPYHVYGGLQDNGSWKGPGFTWKDGGLRNSDWQELLFGDGFDVLPLPGNDQKGYASWQGGNAYFYDLNNGKSEAIQPVHPEGKFLRFNWNAAMALHPALANGLYFGSQFLHKSYDNGRSYAIISPDLTTNDTAKLHQAESGGLTIDATNAENYCTIIAIAPAKSDTNVIWVGTDDGNLQLTKDGGKTWTNLTSKIPGAPKNAWIPFIHVNKANAAEAWVVMNNYRQNDWQPYLFKTTDYGKTWQRLAKENSVSGYCLSVLPDPKVQQLVWLGTDHGLYVSINGGTTWNPWTRGIPNCPVQDLVLQERENDLVVGTFGRGIYILDGVDVFRSIAAAAKPKDLKIMASGHGYLAHYQRPEGERFGADGFFEGENKPFGLPMDIFNPGKKNAKTGKWESGKMTMEIYAGNKKIRSWQVNIDSSGLHRFYWNLRADGYRMPSHHTPKNEEQLPAGMLVSPGTYKWVIAFDGKKDSAMVDVFAPPQHAFNAAGYAEKQRLNSRLKLTVDRAYKAYEALKDAEKTIATASEASYENDSASKLIAKMAKPLKDSIAALKLLFMQAAGVEYYEEITVRLNDKLSAAMGYIQSVEYPGQNAVAAVSVAENLTNQTLIKVNQFFAGPWLDFRKTVEQEKMKVFKEMGGY